MRNRACEIRGFRVGFGARQGVSNEVAPRDLMELRLACLRALGLEPERPGVTDAPFFATAAERWQNTSSSFGREIAWTT